MNKDVLKKFKYANTMDDKINYILSKEISFDNIVLEDELYAYTKKIVGFDTEDTQKVSFVDKMSKLLLISNIKIINALNEVYPEKKILYLNELNKLHEEIKQNEESNKPFFQKILHIFVNPNNEKDFTEYFFKPEVEFLNESMIYKPEKDLNIEFHIYNNTNLNLLVKDLREFEKTNYIEEKNKLESNYDKRLLELVEKHNGTILEDINIKELNEDISFMDR